MCLYPNQRATARLRSQMAATHSKSIVAYKVYGRGFKGCLHSVVYPRHKGGCVYGAGWIESNRRSAKWRESECRHVDEGCHVYLSRTRAKRGGWGTRRIVPVRGYLKDFVAAGCGQAVFTKLYLTKRNFQRAMKG